MKNTKIDIITKSKSYPIYFGNKNLRETGRLIKKNLNNAKKICIISDKKLPSKSLKILINSLKNYSLKIYKFSTNEKLKSFKVANKLIEELLEFNLNRSDCIIAFGGGIISDLSAFVASLVKRGVGLINIPTSLLAQVDASIGGKTGVNSNKGKNLIGTFYQPDFVLIDTSLLNSLPTKQMVCGYGEILKHSLILNRNFFHWLNKNAEKILKNRDKKILKLAILQSCKIKSKVVSMDEKEKNLRMILNFGHTFAHGFEGAKKFSNKLNHGEAVLLGMILASRFSYLKKMLPIKDLKLIEEHYSKLSLPNKISNIFKKKEINKIIYFMKKDKKNLNNKINLVLLHKIGKVAKNTLYKVSQNELKKFFLSNYI